MPTLLTLAMVAICFDIMPGNDVDVCSAVYDKRNQHLRAHIIYLFITLPIPATMTPSLNYQQHEKRSININKRSSSSKRDINSSVVRAGIIMAAAS